MAKLSEIFSRTKVADSQTGFQLPVNYRPSLDFGVETPRLSPKQKDYDPDDLVKKEMDPTEIPQIHGCDCTHVLAENGFTVPDEVKTQMRNQLPLTRGLGESYKGLLPNPEQRLVDPQNPKGERYKLTEAEELRPTEGRGTVYHKFLFNTMKGLMSRGDSKVLSQIEPTTGDHNQDASNLLNHFISHGEAAGLSPEDMGISPDMYHSFKSTRQINKLPVETPKPMRASEATVDVPTSACPVCDQHWKAYENGVDKYRKNISSPIPGATPEQEKANAETTHHEISDEIWDNWNNGNRPSRRQEPELHALHKTLDEWNDHQKHHHGVSLSGLDPRAPISIDTSGSEGERNPEVEALSKQLKRTPGGWGYHKNESVPQEDLFNEEKGQPRFDPYDPTKETRTQYKERSKSEYQELKGDISRLPEDDTSYKPYTLPKKIDPNTGKPVGGPSVAWVPKYDKDGNTVEMTPGGSTALERRRIPGLKTVTHVDLPRGTAFGYQSRGEDSRYTVEPNGSKSVQNFSLADDPRAGKYEEPISGKFLLQKNENHTETKCFHPQCTNPYGCDGNHEVSYVIPGTGKSNADPNADYEMGTKIQNFKDTRCTACSKPGCNGYHKMDMSNLEMLPSEHAFLFQKAGVDPDVAALKEYHRQKNRYDFQPTHRPVETGRTETITETRKVPVTRGYVKKVVNGKEKLVDYDTEYKRLFGGNDASGKYVPGEHEVRAQELFPATHKTGPLGAAAYVNNLKKQWHAEHSVERLEYDNETDKFNKQIKHTGQFSPKVRETTYKEETRTREVPVVGSERIPDSERIPEPRFMKELAEKNYSKSYHEALSKAYPDMGIDEAQAKLSEEHGNVVNRLQRAKSESQKAVNRRTINAKKGEEMPHFIFNSAKKEAIDFNLVHDIGTAFLNGGRILQNGPGKEHLTGGQQLSGFLTDMATTVGVGLPAMNFAYKANQREQRKDQWNNTPDHIKQQMVEKHGREANPSHPDHNINNSYRTKIKKTSSVIASLSATIAARGGDTRSKAKDPRSFTYYDAFSSNTPLYAGPDINRECERCGTPIEGGKGSKKCQDCRDVLSARP